MGANASRHAAEIVANVRHVIAIELLSAAQAIDLRSEGRERLGLATRAAYDIIREQVAFLERDRETTTDIERLAEVIRTERIVQAARSVVAERGGTLA